MEEIVRQLTVLFFFFLSVWHSLKEVQWWAASAASHNLCSAFHSFCLSHFSINLHNLTLFIESGSCLLRRTNKMLPFSLPHNNLFFFPFSAAIPLGAGIPAQDAELHSALQGLAGMRLYVSD